ncbi:hypothetical protein STREPTOSP366_64710 [Streptomyces variabilis]
MRPQGRVLSALGGGPGSGGPVEGPADFGGGGSQAVQDGPPPGQVPGGRQLVERESGGIEESLGVRGEVRGVRLQRRLVTVGL